MTDQYTGRPRGFAFVDMPDTAAARAAIVGLEGARLAGRALHLEEARPREGGRPRWEDQGWPG